MIFTANLSTTTHSAAQVEWLLYVNCDTPHNQHQTSQCTMLYAQSYYLTNNITLLFARNPACISISKATSRQCHQMQSYRNSKNFQSWGSMPPEPPLGGPSHHKKNPPPSSKSGYGPAMRSCIKFDEVKYHLSSISLSLCLSHSLTFTLTLIHLYLWPFSAFSTCFDQLHCRVM